jgi:hypothetical protein
LIIDVRVGHKSDFEVTGMQIFHEKFKILCSGSHFDIKIRHPKAGAQAKGSGFQES